MESFSLTFFTFPLWWYTTGAELAWKRYKRQIHFGVVKSGIVLFARHMREPLYGDYTRSGILFSFFLRIVLIVFKSFTISLRILFASILLLLYFIAIPVTIIMIIYQFFPF